MERHSAVSASNDMDGFGRASFSFFRGARMDHRRFPLAFSNGAESGAPYAGIASVYEILQDLRRDSISS